MSTPIVRRRKRPVEVDTIQWTGTNALDVVAFTGPENLMTFDDEVCADDPEATAAVFDKLHSTWVLVYTGQHIVRGVKGELYPIAEDVLAGTYESADTPLPTARRAEAFTEGARLLEDAACDADWTRTPDYCAGLRAGAELLLANTEKATAAAATATPDFFVQGHTYAREHHGDTIEFLVEHVSTSPDGRTQVAHGWRTRSWDPGWEPSDSDDFSVWVDVTGAGGGRG